MTDLAGTTPSDAKLKTRLAILRALRFLRLAQWQKAQAHATSFLQVFDEVVVSERSPIELWAVIKVAIVDHACDMRHLAHGELVLEF